MQIGSLSASASLAHITPTPRATSPAPAASSAPAAPQATSQPSAAPLPATTSASSSSVRSGTHASSVSDTVALAALYTTTVAGKTYTGDVEYSAGQYVVSVPGLLGATASGSSAQAAEDSLGPVISELA